MSISPGAPSPTASAAAPGASANITTATTTATGNGATANASPSFTTLPMGPLSTAALYLTEADMAQLLRTHREMANRNASTVASEEFWRERCCRTFGDHADCIEPLGKDAFRAFLTAKRHMLGKSKWQPPPLLPGGERFNRLRYTGELLDQCVGASSQDRDDEDPANTLAPSRCATIMEGLAHLSQGKQSQSECGCFFFRKCYWSSKPSPIAERDEWLEYRMADSLAVVKSFVLTPYTSFWQPQAPTYNPIEVYFQLSHPRINGGKQPYYESPRFGVEGLMKRQQFDLPRPILSLGGSARVVLSGMAQRQTLPASMGETANHYHICISYVALAGAVLLSWSLADGEADGPTVQSCSDGDAAAAGETAIQGSIDFRGNPACRKGGDLQSAVKKSPAREEFSARTITGTGGKHPRGVLRLRWTVFVFVHAAVAPSVRRGKGDTDAVERLVVKIKASSDTLCADFLERYAQVRVPKQRPEDGRPVLLVSRGPGGGRALPADIGSGAVLADFASEGRLDVVDASLDGGA